MKNTLKIILFFLPLTSYAIQTDFNGYFRGGVGINNLGGPEACTNAGSPAPNELRWGNECDLYGESTFNFQDEGKVKDWKFTTTFSYGSRNRTDFEQATTNSEVHQFVVREAFLEGRLPESDWTIWAGKRFYRWTDIYFMDFFPMDFSGPGAGISRDNPDKSRTKIAFLRSAVGQEVNGSNVNTDIGKGAKHMFNYQREDMAWGPGKASYWLIYGLTPRATKDDLSETYEQGQGFAAAGKYEITWGLSQHEFGAAYGTGVMSTLAAWGGELVKVCSTATSAQCFVNKSNRLRSWWTMVREGKDLSVETAVIYDVHDWGMPANSKSKWLGFGGMLLFHRSDRFAWVVQAGQSSVVNEQEAFGTKNVYRLSAGPEWRWKSGLWNRPLVRGYVAYTGWNQNFRDAQFASSPINYPFGEEDNAVNVGVQTELWF